MSSTQKTMRRDVKGGKNEDGKAGPKQLTLAEATPLKSSGEANPELEMLAELRKLRQENIDSFRDMKASLTRLESTMDELKQRTEGLDRRLTDTEERIGATEDRGMQHERVLSYLLRREANLALKCDDMENRLRRNNIRLYGIPEGAEKDDMMTFVTDFLENSLELQEGTDIKLERAHRALGPKPKDAAAPPRSIIVRFLDFKVKQTVLQQAWKQRNAQYQGHKIYFDQDYSAEVQRKRKKVREVIKKLKEKNIRAQSPYPAQLRLYLDSGTKQFPSLLEAQSTLEELGVETGMEDRDILERQLVQEGWSTQGGRRKKQQLSTADIRSIINGGNRESVLTDCE